MQQFNFHLECHLSTPSLRCASNNFPISARHLPMLNPQRDQHTLICIGSCADMCCTRICTQHTHYRAFSSVTLIFWFVPFICLYSQLCSARACDLPESGTCDGCCSPQTTNGSAVTVAIASQEEQRQEEQRQEKQRQEEQRQAEEQRRQV